MSFLSFCRCCFVAVALVVTSLGSTLIAAPPVIDSFQVNDRGAESSSSYLIAADAVDGNALTNRAAIKVEASFTPHHDGDYRIEYEMIDEAGAELASVGPFVYSNAIAGVTINDPERGITNFPQRLDPYENHRLRVRIDEFVPVGPPVNASLWFPQVTEVEATGRTILHFPSTVSGDAALNVIPVTTGTFFGLRKWILDTMTNREYVLTTVFFDLHRYDGWAEGSAPVDDVEVEFEVELRRASDDVVVPLNDGGATVNSKTFTQTFSTTGWQVPILFRAPTVLSTAFGNIRLDPAGQLDSINEQYYTHVQVKHVEVPGQAAVYSEATETPATQVFHFNGNLAFGSISTQFSHFAGDPTVVDAGAGTLDLFVDQQSGFIVGHPQHTFGDGSALRVSLFSNGNALYQPGPTVVVSSPPADTGVMNNVRFERSFVTLDGTGARAGIDATLPAGCGYVDQLDETMMDVVFSLPSTPVGQDLLPTAASLTFTPGSPIFVHEETKPVRWECSGLTWFPSQGKIDLDGPVTPHSVRRPFYDALDQIAAVPVIDRTKKGNDEYWNKVDMVGVVSIQANPAGGGMLSAANVVLETHEHFDVHFPYGSTVSWVSGSVTIADDLLVPASSKLTGVSRNTLGYAQHCRDTIEAGCAGADEAFLLYRVTPNGNEVFFTPHGGLHASGTTAFDDKISWGKLNGGAPAAHFAADSFTRANFFMSGHFIPAFPAAISIGAGPGLAHLSGIDPDNLTDLHIPGGADYTAGTGDYPGVNLRASGPDLNRPFQSTLGGSVWNPYDLTANSKFYVRYSGVSGVQQAAGGLSSATGTLFGYAATLDTFGLAWLSNSNPFSRTSGSALVPLPSDFTVKFEELTFNCLGAPGPANIVADEADLRLDYWDAPFRAMHVEFLPGDPCDPSAGCLAVASRLSAQNVPVPLVGTLGFSAMGDILAPGSVDNDCGVTSEFTLPPSLTIRGPRRGADQPFETYAFSPVRKAYLNTHALDDRAEGPGKVGFWNLAGTLDVPFFEDLEVHGHTSANPAEPTSNLFMTSGFGSPAKNFFIDPEFDEIHAGRPTGPGALPVPAYRTSSSHRPTARQNWLGLIDLTYPLEWNSLRRTFRSPEAQGVDLLVLETKHRVDYLSPSSAFLSFDAEFTGVPPINLSNAVFNAIDEEVGVAQAIVSAAGDQVFDAIEGGTDAFANLLADRADKLLGEVVNGVIDPSLDAFFENIKTAVSDAVANQQDVRPAVKAVVDAYLRPGGAPPPPGEGVAGKGEAAAPPPALTALRVVLADLVGEVGNPVGLIPSIDVNLAGIEASIYGLVGNAGEIGNPLPTAGLLGRSGLDEFSPRPFIQDLISNVVGTLAAEYSQALTQANLFALIEEASGTLDEIKGSLEEIRAAVAELRSRLDVGQEFLAELTAFQLQLDTLLLDLNPDALLNAVADEVQAYLDDALDRAEETLPTAADAEAYLDNLREDIEARVRRELMDRLMASDAIQGMHNAIRERLQVVHMAYRGGVDAAFAEVNEIIRKALTGALADLDETFNDFGQEINKVLKTARVTGHGEIVEDALRELSLRAKIELGLPEDDPLRFDGYVRYQQLNSAGPGGCPGPGSPVSASAVEVTLGAQDVDLEWISGGIRADVEGQVGFLVDPLPIPISIGGMFRMSEGSLSFASAEVSDVAGTLKVGMAPAGGGGVTLGENYLGLMGSVSLSASSLTGGVFVGRSCDLEPLRLLNPQLGDLLGGGGFAGGYVFGSGRIPIVDFGCALNLSAGVGAGAFFSVPGPTWGGILQASARGEALCIFSVKGEINMIGLKRGDQFRFSGQGRVSGKIGACPFCKRFGRTVRATLEGGSWDVDY